MVYSAVRGKTVRHCPLCTCVTLEVPPAQAACTALRSPTSHVCALCVPSLDVNLAVSAFYHTHVPQCLVYWGAEESFLPSRLFEQVPLTLYHLSSPFSDLF